MSRRRSRSSPPATSLSSWTVGTAQPFTCQTLLAGAPPAPTSTWSQSTRSASSPAGQTQSSAPETATSLGPGTCLSRCLCLAGLRQFSRPCHRLSRTAAAAQKLDPSSLFSWARGGAKPLCPSLPAMSGPRAFAVQQSQLILTSRPG